MANRHSELNEELIAFIQAQKIFFVATAPNQGRVNLSPKGMDSFRVIDKTMAVWLNVTGSGNETAAHVLENRRMTVMFCSFEGAPLILRLYGTARVCHPRDSEWNGLFAKFKPIPGARQIFLLSIDLVQTSCGMAVPYFDYAGDRDQLNRWAEKKGETGILEYWEKRNRVSLDGKSTGIFPSNRLNSDDSS